VKRKLKSLPEDTVEDLAREAMVTLYRLSRRETLVNPDALATTLVPPAQSAGKEAGVDMLELFRFVVLEHFRQHDAPCHELAIEFFTELSWSAIARRQQLRHSTVIKRWSACMEQVRELAYAQRGPVWEWARQARIV